jgi:hypothetical protein
MNRGARKLWDGRLRPFYKFTFLDDYTEEAKEKLIWDAWRSFEDDTFQTEIKPVYD